MNNLNCEFEDYLEISKTIFDNCKKNPTDFKMTFLINFEQQAIFHIYAKNDLKEYLLFTFNLVKLPDHLTKSSIAFKYSYLYQEVDILEKRLRNVLNVVKWKNPALFLIICNFLEKKE